MKPSIPLAERMRPKSLETYIGQAHIVGEGAVLRKAIAAGSLPSLILWGPPGVGKTTLAYILASALKRPFYSLSAINSGVKDIREVIEKASSGGLFTEKPVLFIDEIHRFSKAQQDSLLGAVETGKITLIGATTENPSFEVISALLSRSQVYILKALEEAELVQILEAAMQSDLILKTKHIILKEKDALLQLSGGDARRLLNIFELVVNAAADDPIEITNAKVLELVQQNPVLYDKAGDNHYDIISAFIKSIRGSDPNGTVYWLARMIEGGEDPLFIARRMVIAASEDIGNANPTALVVATNCFQAVNVIGYPEARIVLSQAATYLATSPKSRAAYEAINNAQQIVRDTGNLPVPLYLRSTPTGTGQDFLPEKISGTKIYDPGQNAREKETREALKRLWGEKYGY